MIDMPWVCASRCTRLTNLRLQEEATTQRVCMKGMNHGLPASEDDSAELDYNKVCLSL